MRPLSTYEIAEKIRNCLIVRGITTKGLSNMLGYEGNNLYKTFSGSVQKIPADLVSQIADLLNVDTDYLLTDTTEERKSVSDVAAFLGLSPDAVRFIQSLDDSQRAGLDAILCDKSQFGKLLQIFGNQKTNAVAYNRIQRVSDALQQDPDELSALDVLHYKVSRLASNLVDWLRS